MVLSVEFAADHGGVMSTEAEAVVHRVSNAAIAWVVWGVIQIAIRIGRIEIDGGWDDVVVAGEDRQDHLDTAAGAEGVSEVSFGAGDGDRSGGFPEDIFDGHGFGFVAERGAGAVGVDVIDIARVELSVGEGVGHGPCSTAAMFVWGGDMAGVARPAVADDLAVDACAASFRMLKFFEDQDTAAFAEDESVSVGIEGSASFFRGIVACGQGLHVGETGHAHGGDGGFGTAGQHDVGFTVLNGFESVAHRVVGASAGGGNGEIGAAQTILNRQIPSGGVEHHFGDGERADPIRPLAEQTEHLFFDFVEPPDAGAQDRTAAVGVFFAKVDAAICDRVIRGPHCELGESIESLGILCLAGRAGIESRHIATESNFVVRSIDDRERVNPALARENPLPQRGDIQGHGCHAPEACYNNSTFHSTFAV